MLSLWDGTFGDLKRLVKSGDHEVFLRERFRSSFGEPSDSEVASWKRSLIALTNALSHPVFDTLQVILELQMPIGAERADVVLFGGHLSDPRAYIIELKQWSSGNGSFNSKTLEFTIETRQGKKLYQHPSLQVLNYRGKLYMFNSLATTYSLKSAVFLHNLSKEAKKVIADRTPEDILREAPLFCGEEQDAFAQSIYNHLLPTRLRGDECQRFRDAPFEQTNHLFKAFTNHALDIAERAVVVLAENGIGLTEEQELLVEEILSKVRPGQEQVFIIQGGPGSGKTLLAVTLLLRGLQVQAFKRRSRCVMAVHGSRLLAVLRQCLKDSKFTNYPGASGVMMFFEVPRNGTGLADDNFQGEFDLVICDEAQRMRRGTIKKILRKAPVYVMLLDEKQRLNPADEGSIDAFVQESLRMGKTPISMNLTAAMRCRGGHSYHIWVDTLLQEPGKRELLYFCNQSWPNDYQCGVYESAEEMVHALEVLRGLNPDQKVALMASFTESPGGNINERSNFRVGYPLIGGLQIYKGKSLSLQWLMEDSDYVKFWLGKESNRLNRISSIYGAQGLECDYTGIFWGRDLLFRDGQWKLGDASVCYDRTYGLVDRRTRKWASGALELVQNRYRIFLTRGMKGTFIFAEDEETRQYLLSILHGNVLLSNT